MPCMHNAPLAWEWGSFGVRQEEEREKCGCVWEGDLPHASCWDCHGSGFYVWSREIPNILWFWRCTGCGARLRKDGPWKRLEQRAREEMVDAEC